MKQLFMIFAILMTGAVGQAATSVPVAKPSAFVFKYRYKGENLEVRRQMPTYEQAFEQAAQTCFDHYKRNFGGKLTEEQGLDVIDVCANPRSS